VHQNITKQLTIMWVNLHRRLICTPCSKSLHALKFTQKYFSTAFLAIIFFSIPGNIVTFQPILVEADLHVNVIPAVCRQMMPVSLKQMCIHTYKIWNICRSISVV